MRKWTAEERQRQSELIRKQKPWLHSTGPKTKRGKNRCKMNATRHGYRSRGYRELCEALRAQARFIREMRRATANFNNTKVCKRPLIYGVNEGILLSGRSVRFLIHENHKNFRPVRSGAMSMHKKIFSKIFRGCLLSATAISLAGVANASSESLLQPDSDWAVSKISTSQQVGGGAYCALARRFNNDTVLTFARNARDESSIAIDFQNDSALDRNTNYYVSIKAGGGAARSFTVHPVSGRALVVRLGKDYAFYDALNRAAQLDVKIAADNYSFTMSDFTSGQEQMNGCLADLIEPAAAPPDRPATADIVPRPAAIPVLSVTSAPANAPPALVASDTVTPKLAVSSTELIKAPFSASDRKTEPAGEEASDSRSADKDQSRQIQVLHEENIRLRNALETQRRNYESAAVLDDKNSSLAAELNEKIGMLQRQNDDLRHQLTDRSLSGAAPATASADIKALQDENRRLHDQLEQMQSKSDRQVAADAGMKSETDSKLKEAQARLAEAERKAADADQKRAAAERKLAEADKKASAVPATPKEDAKSSRALAGLKKQVAKLEAENTSLKDSLHKAMESAKPMYVSENAEVSDARLRSLSEKLAKVQDERDTLSRQVESLLKHGDRSAVNISSSNWNLEQSTKRYNEAERELRRLSVRVEESRAQCDAEKKKIEYQLFDPAVASKQQIAKLSSLQHALDRASADLMIERDKVALLEAKLKAEQAASAVPVAAIEKTPVPTNISTAMMEQPMPVASIPAVERTEQPSAKPVLDARALLEAPEKSLPQPLPDRRMMTASALHDLLVPEVLVGGEIKRVDAPEGTVAYNWKSGSLFGSAEQQVLDGSSSSGSFDTLVSKYLARTKARCLGTFAAKPGAVRDAAGVKATEYEIACVGGSGNISASVLFYSRNGIFTAIAHEGSVDNMDDAMDLRDKLAAKILQTRLASN